MNWYRGPTSTTEPAVKPEGAGKKLRRKLQKIGTQQRWYHPKESNHGEAKKVGASTVTRDNNAVLETPDPNDGKWLEQLRKSGQLCRGPPVVQPNKKPHRHSMQVIPEFAHLGINEEISRKPLDKRASCATPSSTSSVTRRYAKTPVYQIGQLENWPGRDQPVAHKVSSVERIAESYRALLESSCAMLNDTTQEPLPLRLGKTYPTETKNHINREDIRSSDMGSPHSDDGTLVAFDEDTVSLKPGSISSPEPPSPCEGGRVHEHRHGGGRKREHKTPREPIPLPKRTPPTGSPSLQICLDLLGQELSSAASGSSLRPNAETSALQVWVMIEAYERLRDQLLGMHLDHDQESLSLMLDTWIKALYEIHERMTGCDGHVSDSEYGD